MFSYKYSTEWFRPGESGISCCTVFYSRRIKYISKFFRNASDANIPRWTRMNLVIDWMSMLSIRNFRVMSKYLPLVAQNKSRCARLAFPGTPSIPLFRAFHSRQFPSCIEKKRIVKNNCYCEAQCDSRRQEISALTAHYSRSAETEFETTPWRLSRWIIPRLPRSVPMDEELKYKRYRENITNSVFSDDAMSFEFINEQHQI